ncbi:MAG: SDR family NAD(P)-dependent oxidoreductase [Microthrixaceae bacterium]
MLITGVTGFIGSHLASRLVTEGVAVCGVDKATDTYSSSLRRARLDHIGDHERFRFVEADLCDAGTVEAVFDGTRPSTVVHLAASAGVRKSLVHPEQYFANNLTAFFNVMQACRTHRVGHLVYASSSSVYGSTATAPFHEDAAVDEPVSFYAATKRCDELMAYSFARNHGLAATGLRFFTVYGPMGRPDMAYYSFTDRYFAGEPIVVFNDGDAEHDLTRDFTYIDDIVEGVVRVLGRPATGPTPHRLFNIGNSRPVRLMDFVAELESALSGSLGRPVTIPKVFEPLRPGDVPATHACVDRLADAVGFRPSTALADGLRRFTDWYVEFHGIS